MVFYVYILHCNDDSYYTGHTDDLEKRLIQHNVSESPAYTATRKPLKLIFYQEFFSREEALKAERQIKGWSRKKKEAIINHNWKELKRLSRGKNNVNELENDK